MVTMLNGLLYGRHVECITLWSPCRMYYFMVAMLDSLLYGVENLRNI